MDSTALTTRVDATATVSRDYEPVRIERQLLARAFDLVCDIANQATEEQSKSPMNIDSPVNTVSVDMRRRPAA
jgi:hypothetical protein